MDVRFSTDPKSLKTMKTEELRSLFLMTTLFEADRVPMVYSDIDRSITGSAVPVEGTLELLASKKEMAADYFAERREVGVINIGGSGTITIDGTVHRLAMHDALYIGRGARSVVFASEKKDEPAAFYFVSYPAHTAYPTTLITLADAEHTALGSVKDSNKRVINKYIHPRGVKSCQLVMGMTALEEGSVWNTMPVHTHQRRSEVYMYFDLPSDAVVFHLMGEPDETRHIVVRNRQAVLSPSWSIHSGCATRNYKFIWAMGGENQVFEDMDGVAMGAIG
ncbi:MAG: 5-dehydro-4-deoxy-D-glucuronate isomerase [Acidobacteriota bacterium]